MRFSCEGCSAKYMISDDKVGPSGVKVRCKKCGHVTHVRRGEPEGAPVHGGALAAEWWVAIADQPVGPVGIEVVQHHWDQGEIGLESLVWCSALTEWTPLASVPELHAHLGGGKPVAPPAAAPAPTPPPAPAPVPSPAPDDEWRPGAASRWPGWTITSRGTWIFQPRHLRARPSRRQPPGHFRPRAPPSGPIPPGSCPCPWPGWSGPEDSESPSRRGRKATGPGRTRRPGRATRSPSCCWSRWPSWRPSGPACGG